MKNPEMNESMRDLMHELNRMAFHGFGNCVIQGPFKGMLVRQNSVWDDGNSSTKLLGSYEFELHDTLDQVINVRKPKTIINVGCAEGYYAVGFARALPEATVYAFDIREECLAECERMAERNNVFTQVRVGLGCKSARELDIDAPDRLYLMDSEGAEIELLDKEQCPALITSDIIVECHEFMYPGLTDTLKVRFCDTHQVRMISPKLPPFERYPFLLAEPSAMNMLLVIEKRPMPTNWLVCWAHQRS